MIGDFISSWTLFHNTYLTGYLISVLLSMIGVLVVARDQIFIGAAASQASTLGIALAMWIGSAFESIGWSNWAGFPSLMAVLFCVAATLFTWRGGKPKSESYEAATGWIFLASASVSILIVSRSPHGLEEIYRLLSSNILGSTRQDVWMCSVLAMLTIMFFLLMHRPLLLLAIDPEMAVAVGMKRSLWEYGISIWLGLTVGLGMRSSGMLYTFGCLVLPPLIAKNLCREVRTMFYASPLIALFNSAAAFVLANRYDFPPAQVTVAMLCLFLCVAWAKPKVVSGGGKL